ncbi:unnamed protein product [Rotaria sp. Silwood1]|nr:unnamed protein product [Rotaria sp. Silwood1]CAF1184631.1 unnamed protein product [Rotaria sp. Silwood1]
MRLSNISTAPYRPQIKSISQGDVQSFQFTNGFTSSFASSTNRWFNQKQNRISPEMDTTWMYNHKLRTNTDNKKKNYHRACFWILVVLILILIVGAVIGIVLGLTLLITTTTPTTQISIACSNTGHGVLALQNQTTPTTWTSYSRSFTPTSAAPTLIFGFQIDGTNSFYLDTVSVIDSTLSSTQLLTNPNFENSTTTPTGWIISCEATTCGSSAASIVTNSQCSSGYCFESSCSSGRSALIFLSQTFATTSGNLHTVSYMLKRTNIGSSGIMAFYLDVV